MTLVQPLSLWWARIRCMCYCFWHMERILVFTEERSFRWLPWFPVDYVVLSLESESGYVFYRTPKYDPAERDRRIAILRAGLSKLVATVRGNT